MFQMYMIHPNIIRWCTAGLFPCYATNGVTSFILFIGHMFNTYTTVLTASP
jgi:hypothetical protein